MNLDKLRFRVAQKGDSPTILKFIRELAKYEKLEHDVVADEATLDEWLFDKASAEVIFACIDDAEVGFMLYFTNFSSFLGKAGLYVEDIFVTPEYRGCGIGTAMLKYIARMAYECDFGRVEWACLDWNSDSIEFYKSLGAVAMDDWTIYRLTADKCEELAKK